VPRPLNIELGGTGRNDGNNLRRGSYVSPLDSPYNGAGDGVSDDTAAIQGAINNGRVIDLRNKYWKVTSRLVIPSDRTFLMQGAIFITIIPSDYLFCALNGASLITVYGGRVTGSLLGAWFLQGKTDQPSAQSDYASQITFFNHSISDVNIITAVTYDKAVNTIDYENCNFFAVNGINCSAAAIACTHSNTIIYGADGTGFGVKTRSTGGTAYYSQGFHFVNCPAIDNFATSFDVTDMYVFEVVNSYVGCASGGKTFSFRAPSTNLCDVLNIGSGTTIQGGPIDFVASAGGQAYNANINGATFSGVPGTAIAIHNNAAQITVSDCKFKSASGTAYGVVGDSNNAQIVVRGIDCDSTYTTPVILNGSIGAACMIDGISGQYTGDSIGLGRPVLVKNVPVSTSNVAALKETYSASNLGGGATYTVGTTIDSLAVGFVKGETGNIVLNLPYSGASATTQNVQIALPAGMVTGSGVSYSSLNRYTGAASGNLTAEIAYHCTADGSGNVTVKNQAGNTLTIDNQGYFGVVKDW